MFHDGAQVAGLLVDAKLALGAGALVENGVHVLDGAAAAEVVDHVVDEGEQLDGKVAHGHFGLLAEIDELAFDAVASGAPLVFFDEGAAVNAEAHVAGVEAMQLDDEGLGERGNGHSFFDFGGDIAHAELERAERRMRAHVPPDFFAAVDAVELNEEAEKIFVGAPGFELLGNAGARETAKDGSAEGFQAGVATHPERRAGGEREQVRKEIANHVHHVDRGLLVGHGDVYVHAEDQEGACELLEFLDDVRRSGRDELHYVGAELTGGGVNDLKFFFYADGKAVSHGVALRVLGLWGLLSAYHTPSVVKIALLRCISSGHVQVERSGPRLRLDHPCPVSGDAFRSTPKARRNGKKGTEPVDLAALRSTYKEGKRKRSQEAVMAREHTTSK